MYHDVVGGGIEKPSIMPYMTDAKTVNPHMKNDIKSHPYPHH